MYAKLNVGQLLKIMQIDAKFVSLMCLALLRKLDRGTAKYEMGEVRYLIYVLLRELMQTPLVGFEAKQKKRISRQQNKMLIKESVGAAATSINAMSVEEASGGTSPIDSQ